MEDMSVKNLVLSGRQIVTGSGAIGYLKKLSYKRVIIVTGGSSMIKNGIIDKAKEMLIMSGSGVRVISGIKKNPSFEEVDEAFKKAVENGATPVLEPELEPWGQRTCYIADPEGNLIEIGSWNKPYEEKDK